MSKWNMECEEFKGVRKMINEDNPDYENIINKLVDICKKYAKQTKWNWHESYADLVENIEEDLQFMDDDWESWIDYYLNEFYDLCDAAKVWLAI